MDKKAEDVKVRKKMDIEILIDASGSMKENDPNMDKAKEIINEFISKRDGNYDRVGVTVFRGPSMDLVNGKYTIVRPQTIEVTHSLDGNLNNAKEAVNAINPGGFTPLLDGLDKAKGDLDANSRKDADNKILIVLGDGHPNIGPKRDHFYGGLSGSYYGKYPNYYPSYEINEEIKNLNENSDISSEDYFDKLDKLEGEARKLENLYPGAEKRNLSLSESNKVLEGTLYDNSKPEFYDLKYLVEQKAQEIKNSGYEVYSVFLNNEKKGSSSYKEFLENTNENEKLFRNIATDDKHFLYADDLNNLLENFKVIDSSFMTFDYNLQDQIEDGYSLVPGSFKTSIDGIAPKVNSNSIKWNVNDTNNNHFEVSYNIVKKIPNTPPIINAEDKSIKQGDNFDPLKDITATDEQDGDIAIKSENVIKNTVDTTIPGKYEVTYEVTDSKGDKGTKTIIVTVLPKMEKLNRVPEINASDVTIMQDSTFDPLENVTANDVEDGTIKKENIKVIKNGVDTATPGKYEVTYSVTDSKGATSTKTINVNVLPSVMEIDEAPVINAKDREINQGDVFDPLEDVNITDKEDGQIPNHKVVVNHKVDPSTPGDYDVLYEVTDSKGNKSTKKTKVKVLPINMDTTKPTEKETANKEVETPKEKEEVVSKSSEVKAKENVQAITNNKDTKVNEVQGNNPKTGDLGVIPYAELGLIAVAMLVLNTRRKK